VGAPKCGKNFSKVLYIEALHSIYTRALTYFSKILYMEALHSMYTRALTYDNLRQVLHPWVCSGMGYQGWKGGRGGVEDGGGRGEEEGAQHSWFCERDASAVMVEFSQKSSI
jgi:hypothetical protein